MIDDFFFMRPANNDLCSASLRSFLRLAEDIGVPIKKEKTLLPATCLTIYGVEIDSAAMTARLPLDKVEKIRTLLNGLVRREKVTLQELLSLLGLLNFATAVVVPGRTFMNAILSGPTICCHDPLCVTSVQGCLVL
jgi:hypothetical protein